MKRDREMECKTFFSVSLGREGFSTKQEIVPLEQINIRNGIAYKVNSDTPFSGVMVEYYENGQINRKENCKDGKLNGEWVKYYENGQIESKGNCKDGKLDGEWVKYYENGQIESKGKYIDGEMVE